MKMLKFLPVAIVILLVIGGFVLYSSQQSGSNNNSSNTSTQQSSNKSPRIGILAPEGNLGSGMEINFLKDELANLGYTPVFLEADKVKNNDFSPVADKFVDQKADFIVASGAIAAIAAKKSTTTIPIIFSRVGEPVMAKVLESDKGGGNIVGISSQVIDLSPLRIEWLKKIMPNIKKTYLIHTKGDGIAEKSASSMRDEAKKQGITLVEKYASNTAEAKQVAASLKAAEAEAITLSGSVILLSNIQPFIEAQNREKIPLMAVDQSTVSLGGALAYGPDLMVVGKQQAKLIDQIIKGRDPKTIPVQKPEKVTFMYNLKALEQLGLSLNDEIKKQGEHISR